jgi:undecaprenyl-diphosphatase
MAYMHILHALSLVTDNIQAIISRGGYPFLFLMVFLEGIPFLGTAVPGHVTILAAGFLAKIGVLSLGYVLLLSAVAAILGDSVGFFLGRKYGLSLIDRLKPHFFITDAHVAKAQALLAAHTGKTMILGRLSPVTRALMPFLVGASETSAGKFWLFNIIGGIIWTAGSVMVGYAFGASYHAIAGYLGGFVVAAIVGAILIAWGYRFVNLRFAVFRRYELFALALNLISLGTLAATIQDAWSKHSFMANFDIWVNGFMLRHVGPFGGASGLFLAHLAAWVSDMGHSAVFGLLGLALGGYFLYRKKWRSGGIMIMSVCSAGGVDLLMKDFFMRARPLDALQLLPDPSFPSGHATMAAAFLIAFAYLMARRIRSRTRRELLIVGSVLVIIAVGVARIALNVHWASDVIAGWSLGAFCATASILFVRYIGVLVLDTRK